jgi:lincosamide and streptogramin A transport system ATP-binding/permease protein
MSTISVNNLTFGYEGAPGDVFEGVSFAFDTDWKLGLIGRNGRGKTTLLRLLLGDHEYRGSISFSAQFLYFPFDVENESLTPSEIMKSVCSVGEFWELCREANLLGVDAEALLRPFLSLSGGEKTKILLSILFIKSEHEGGFLLLDEPTNHLDAQGKSDILRYLSGKRGFLLVSHDRTLLDAVCDHIVSIGRAEIEVVAGNFSS